MNNSPFRRPALFCFLLYVLILLRLIVFRGSPVLIAEHFKNFSLASFEPGYAFANFIPFKNIFYYLSPPEIIKKGLENIGGNIAAFIPFGILLSFIVSRQHSLQKILLLSFLTSFLFEILQLAFALGIFDVDDILLNVSGGLTGYLIFILCNSLLSTNKEAKRTF
jgi:glycopeptide antibiotics resistance protein